MLLTLSALVLPGAYALPSMTFGIIFLSVLQAFIGGLNISQAFITNLVLEWFMFVIGLIGFKSGHLLLIVFGLSFYLYFFLKRFGYLFGH